MHINTARKLEKYHKFTKIELYDMLVEALDTHNESYWKEANHLNGIFDNGAYFNLCRNWIGYKKGENDNDYSSEVIVIRVLQGFGKFSKIQLPKKKKQHVKIMKSEKPTL